MNDANAKDSAPGSPSVGREFFIPFDVITVDSHFPSRCMTRTWKAALPFAIRTHAR
jgi:hypothetical protein